MAGPEKALELTWTNSPGWYVVSWLGYLALGWIVCVEANNPFFEKGEKAAKHLPLSSLFGWLREDPKWTGRFCFYVNAILNGYFLDGTWNALSNRLLLRGLNKNNGLTTDVYDDVKTVVTIAYAAASAFPFIFMIESEGKSTFTYIRQVVASSTTYTMEHYLGSEAVIDATLFVLGTVIKLAAGGIRTIAKRCNNEKPAENLHAARAAGYDSVSEDPEESVATMKQIKQAAEYLRANLGDLKKSGLGGLTSYIQQKALTMVVDDSKNYWEAFCKAKLYWTTFTVIQLFGVFLSYEVVTGYRANSINTIKKIQADGYLNGWDPDVTGNIAWIPLAGLVVKSSYGTYGSIHQLLTDFCLFLKSVSEDGCCGKNEQKELTQRIKDNFFKVFVPIVLPFLIRCTLNLVGGVIAGESSAAAIQMNIENRDIVKPWEDDFTYGGTIGFNGLGIAGLLGFLSAAATLLWYYGPRHLDFYSTTKRISYYADKSTSLVPRGGWCSKEAWWNYVAKRPVEALAELRGTAAPAA